jgi:spore maturation protein CgeB
MTTRPRIAFFGSSLVSAYWNGAATYYRGIVRALSERGYDITFYEPDAYDRQQHRDMPDPDWARVVVYDADEPSVYRALEAARSADIIVKTSGVGVFDDLLDDAVLAIRDPKRWRCSGTWTHRRRSIGSRTIQPIRFIGSFPGTTWC